MICLRLETEINALILSFSVLVPVLAWQVLTFFLLVFHVGTNYFCYNFCS